MDYTKYEDKDTRNEDERNLVQDVDQLNTKESDKLTEWKKEPTIEDLKGDLEFSREDNLAHRSNIDGWLDLRNVQGKEAVNNKSKGRSSVVPKMIRKHNEWRYPSLSEPFLNTDRMCQVLPRESSDQESAKQNEILLNWQWDTRLNKVDFIDRYVRTTVDTGTAVIRIGWDRKTETVTREEPVYEYFPVESEEEETILVQARQLKDSDPEAYEALEDELIASVEYSISEDTPVIARRKGYEPVRKRQVTMNQPSVKIVNSKNIFVDPSCEGVWSDAQYIIYTYSATKSDLKKRGIFKNLDKVAWSSENIMHKDGTQDFEHDGPQIDNRTTKEKQQVLVYEYWGLYDVDGDGEAIPIVVSWIGNTIIQMEENPFPDKKPPFVIVPYMPILDSAMGEADASLLQDAQRINGAVTRGMIDLLGRSANGQTGYKKGFLDPVNRRRFTIGEDYEFNPNSDIRTSMQTQVFPEIPNSAHQMVAMQNQEAEGLSGVKSFASGVSGESYGKVARGISGALDAAALREINILRRLAEGMKMILIKMSSLNAVYLSEKEVIRVTNTEFIEIHREDLRGNFDMKVDISTQTMDESRANDLGFMLQTMGPDMDPGLSRMIIAEIADLKRMPRLAEQVRNYQPQPDPVAEKLRELEVRLKEAEVELEVAKAEEARAKAANINNETELESTGVKHARAVEAQGAQARGNRNLEVTKKLLDGSVPAANVEAAVGFNELTERDDQARRNPVGRPANEIDPLQQVRSTPELPTQQNPSAIG